ncbi:hypothetical protein D7V97_23485 [Corallococcus sp. CA053C]|nr:hypothetical protein D7V97_23485 [Corallococcus sp. CA053C]
MSRDGALKALERVASKEWWVDAEALHFLQEKAAPAKSASASGRISGVTAVPQSRGARYEAFINPPKGRELEPDTTFVVPTFKDFGPIRQKQAEVRKQAGVELTESQGWALVLADIRGRYEQERNRHKAVRRLEEFNADWGTHYTQKDLDAIFLHLSTRTRLATNYTFSKRPGANINSQGSSRLLGELLMEDTEFRNTWETRASQAAVNDERRGAVEEAMGYGAVLRRTQGAALHQESSDVRRLKEKGQFSPLSHPELPKYAALVSQYQRDGVASRYGVSVVYWKPALRWRITHTPGDSWNLMFAGAYHGYTSPRYPEGLLAWSDPILMRLAAAEATGQDKAFLKGAAAKGVVTDAYIETQVHGPLRWADVEELVIGAEENAEALKQGFIRFRDRAGYGFKVSGKDPGPAAQHAEAVLQDIQGGSSMFILQWLRFDIAGYREEDWTAFVGALDAGQQCEVARYLTSQCTESLLARLRKQVPAALLPGGRPDGDGSSSGAATKAKAPGFSIPSSHDRGTEHAAAVAEAVEFGVPMRISEWLNAELPSYDAATWERFVDALDVGARRRVGIYLMEECTESLLKRLRTCVPAAILPGGRVLHGKGSAAMPPPSSDKDPKPSGSSASVPLPVPSTASSTPVPQKQGRVDGARGLLTPQGPVESGITRVACLSQNRNTCGQRAAYNAIAFLRSPGNTVAAAQRMADHDALHRLGDMQADVYDEAVRALLDRNGGQDIALVWNLDRIQRLLMDETLIADDGDHALYGFLHRRRRTVQVVINTHAALDPSNLEQILAASSVSHYFAAELHWGDSGKLEIAFADSLVDASDSQEIVEQLKTFWGG